MRKIVAVLVLAASACLLAACAAPASHYTRDTFLFSPYKYIQSGFNAQTGVISTELLGKQQPVAEALPEGLDALTLAFAAGDCENANWEGVPGATLAKANMQRLAKAGVSYIIATGGANLTFTCKTPAQFLAFIDTYHTPYMLGVDFDIENGQSQAMIDNLVRNAKAAQQRYPNMRFSFTLATFGSTQRDKPALGDIGLKVMQAIRQQHYEHFIINLMVMDYDKTDAQHCTLGSDGLCDMGASAVAAVEDFHQRFGVPYSQIEATPMIGGNDNDDEIFTLKDARQLASYAKKVGLIGIHFWSFDRDHDCAQGDPNRVCNNYGHAGTLAYTKVFLANDP